MFKQKPHNELPGPSHWNVQHASSLCVTRTHEVPSRVLNPVGHALGAAFATFLVTMVPVVVSRLVFFDEQSDVQVVLLAFSPVALSVLVGLGLLLTGLTRRRREVRRGRVIVLKESPSRLHTELVWMSHWLSKQPSHVRTRTAGWCDRGWQLLLEAGPLLEGYSDYVALKDKVEYDGWSKAGGKTRAEVKAHLESQRAVTAYKQAAAGLLERVKSFTEMVRTAVEEPEVAARRAQTVKWEKDTAARLNRLAQS